MSYINKYSPMMSASAVNFITKKITCPISSHKKYYVVEYGSGMSTLFFTNKLAEAGIECTYIAVERSHGWFEKIRNMLDARITEKNRWGIGNYLEYLVSPGSALWYIPKQCRRLPKVKMNMLKRFPKIFVSQSFKEGFGQKKATSEILGFGKFDYFYIYEGFKDQYGESPNKYIYIYYPLGEMIKDLEDGLEVFANIIVDGGPRADIVQRMHALTLAFPKLSVSIFLLEAGRGFYSPVLSSLSSGQYIPAKENVLIDGSQYLQKKKRSLSNPSTCMMGSENLQYALNTELWYYTNETRQT